MFIAPTIDRPLSSPLPATYPHSFALRSFPSPLNHAGFFSYLAAPPTLSLPFDPLLPLHPGVSAVLRVFCFETFRLLFSLSSYPRPFRAHSLPPSLSLSTLIRSRRPSLFANVSPYVVPFFRRSSRSYARRSRSIVSCSSRRANSRAQTGSLRPRRVPVFES